MKHKILILLFSLLSNACLFAWPDSSNITATNLDTINSNLVYYQIATKFNYIGAYDLALSNYVKSLKGYEKANNTKAIADISKEIGNLYLRHINDFNKAIVYYHNAMSNYKSLSDNINIAGLNNNLSICYSKMKKYDIAYEYLIKSFTQKLELGDTNYIVSTVSNLGELAFYLGRYEEALKYFRKTKKLSADNYWSLGYTEINFARLFIQKKQYQQALKHLDIAKSISESNQYNELLKVCYQEYVKVYSALNNIDFINKYNQLYLAIKDSIYNEKGLSILTEMQTKYDTKKKEKENLILKSENEKSERIIALQNQRIITLIAGLIIIASFLVIIIIQFRKQRLANNILVQKNLEIVAREAEIQNSPKDSECMPEEKPIQSENNKKYASSNLTNERKDDIANQITTFLTDDMPYLNANFTLQELADNLEMSRSYISQVINEKFGINFNSLVNDYRIREARRRLSDPQNHNITIEAIANDVGFKSKSTFYSAFKKFSGVTPTFYLKNVKP